MAATANTVESANKKSYKNFIKAGIDSTHSDYHNNNNMYTYVCYEIFLPTDRLGIIVYDIISGRTYLLCNNVCYVTSS